MARVASVADQVPERPCSSIGYVARPRSPEGAAAIMANAAPEKKMAGEDDGRATQADKAVAQETKGRVEAAPFTGKPGVHVAPRAQAGGVSFGTPVGAGQPDIAGSASKVAPLLARRPTDDASGHPKDAAVPAIGERARLMVPCPESATAPAGSAPATVVSRGEAAGPGRAEDLRTKEARRTLP